MIVFFLFCLWLSTLALQRRNNKKYSMYYISRKKAPTQSVGRYAQGCVYDSNVYIIIKKKTRPFASYNIQIAE